MFWEQRNSTSGYVKMEKEVQRGRFVYSGVTEICCRKEIPNKMKNTLAYIMSWAIATMVVFTLLPKGNTLTERLLFSIMLGVVFGFSWVMAIIEKKQ